METKTYLCDFNLQIFLYMVLLTRQSLNIALLVDWCMGLQP